MLNKHSIETFVANQAPSIHKVAIVVSQFNDFITDKLLDGTLSALNQKGLKEEQLTIVQVPGAFELPFIAKKLIKTGQYSGIICLGAVIRGSTPHFDYVCQGATSGIINLNLSEEIPTIFGVITCDTTEQALERVGIKMQNKGIESAHVLLDMLSISQQIDKIPVNSSHKLMGALTGSVDSDSLKLRTMESKT